jgi:hypothetical protein
MKKLLPLPDANVVCVRVEERRSLINVYNSEIDEKKKDSKLTVLFFPLFLSFAGNRRYSSIDRHSFLVTLLLAMNDSSHYYSRADKVQKTFGLFSA